jgi:hypothetical protein
MPLQLWLGGGAFGLLGPSLPRADVLVLAVINHLAFAGTLWVTCLVARRRSGVAGAFIATLLAVSLRTDVWVTFSGV